MATLEPTGKALTYFNEVVLKVNPKASFKAKSASLQQKIIGFLFKWIVPFNREYMERYITVMGDTIWMPSRDLSEESMFQLLVHENIHFKQKKKYGDALFSFLYLFPLTVAPIAGLLAFALHSWLVGLLALLLLGPLPAFWRFCFEVQAYRVSLILANHTKASQEHKDKVVEWVVTQLAERYYYFCWPFKNHVKSTLISDSSINDPVYSDLYAFLTLHP